jgi:hypothetical protein
MADKNLLPAVLFLSMVMSIPLVGQTSRTEAIAQQQTEKAAASAAYVPSKAERIFLAVKRELIDTPSGLYPLIGSIYGGGGLALGAGYREYYGDKTHWDIKGMWSIRNYKFAELSTTSPGHAGGRIDLNAQAGWRDATQVAYFGIGIATSRDDRANFRFNEAYAGASAKVRPVQWIVLGTGLNYEDYKTKEGLGTHPSIETVYTAATAPGLGVSPKFMHSTASAGIDWRPSPGYARRGGLYEMRYHNYADRKDTYSFDRVEAEVVQHLPILRENWVLSGRALAETMLNDSDKAPYFLLSSLGSASTLRGFSSWRFRDRHSLLLQGEFRWIPNRTGLDVAVFYDAGKVAGTRRELRNLKRLKSDVGIEARFHGPGSTPLRLGVARGNEGWRVVFGGSAAF